MGTLGGDPYHRQDKGQSQEGGKADLLGSSHPPFSHPWDVFGLAGEIPLEICPGGLAFGEDLPRKGLPAPGGGGRQARQENNPGRGGYRLGSGPGLWALSILLPPGRAKGLVEPDRLRGNPLGRVLGKPLGRRYAHRFP